MEARSTVISRVADRITLFSLAVFALGLWLGYLGAVEQAESCWRQPEPGVEPSCLEWVTSGH